MRVGNRAHRSLFRIPTDRSSRPMSDFVLDRTGDCDEQCSELASGAFSKFVYSGTFPPLNRHASAFRSLCKYRAMCLDGTCRPNASAFTFLTLSGVHLQKCLDSSPKSDIDDAVEIQTTIRLLFVFAVEIHAELRRNSEPIRFDPEEYTLGWQDGSSSRAMQQPPVASFDSASDAALSCLHLGASGSWLEGETETTLELPVIFFRAASIQLMDEVILKASALADAERAVSFVSLEKSSFVENPETPHAERLRMIVGLAESEAGQSLLRDTILSLKLPRSVLGVRGTYLIDRAVNRTAASDNTDLVNEAHNAAMCGAVWCWGNEGDVTLQTAAVLAGLGVLFCGTKGTLAKTVPYGGRVILPWLCAPPNNPSSLSTKLLYSPTFDTWTAFSNRANSEIDIHCRVPGIQGLIWGASILASDAQL